MAFWPCSWAAPVICRERGGAGGPHVHKGRDEWAMIRLRGSSVGGGRGVAARDGSQVAPWLPLGLASLAGCPGRLKAGWQRQEGVQAACRGPRKLPATACSPPRLLLWLPFSPRRPWPWQPPGSLQPSAGRPPQFRRSSRRWACPARSWCLGRGVGGAGRAVGLARVGGRGEVGRNCGEGG